MPTLGQVRDQLVAMATAVVYPNGTSQSSVTGKTVTLMGGWPEPADVDAAMKAGASIVNVYPVPGATGNAEQLFEPPQTISLGTVGLAISVTQPGSITLTGTPNIGEYVLVSIDHEIGFAYTAVANDTAATVATALATLIATKYAGTSASNGTIAVVGSHWVECGNASPAVTGQMLWRQKQRFQIVIISPNDTDRNTLEAAIDPMFKSSLRLTFTADSSQGIIVFNTVTDDDLSEKMGEFRRNLFYSVTYSTNTQYPGYPVISVVTETIPSIYGYPALPPFIQET